MLTGSFDPSAACEGIQNVPLIKGNNMNEKNKPIAKVVRGSIRIAIWAQKGKYGTFYTMSPSRRYRKGEDWMSSNSYPEDEALALSKAFLDASDAIRALRAKDLQESRA